MPGLETVNIDSLPTDSALAKLLGVRADGTSGGRTLAGLGADLAGDATAAASINHLAPNSVLRFLPEAEHAAILARTSTFDCSPYIQTAIDSGVSSLHFPGGLYNCKLIEIRAGLNLYSLSFAELKLPASQAKFTPILKTYTNLWADTHQNENSPILRISGFVLNGNRANQGTYTEYELEQQHAIYVDGSGPTNAAKTRLRVTVENCLIKETCGDGISVFRSVDITVNNVYFWNCFRGGVVCTGANSIVRTANLSCGGDIHNSHFQIEIDGPVNGQSNIIVQDINSTFDHLMADPAAGNGLDIVCGAGSVVQISNSTFKAGIYTVYSGSPDCNISIENCFIRQNSSYGNLQFPGRLKFKTCRFLFAQTVSSEKILNVLQQTGKNEIRFKDCSFGLEYDLLASVTPITISSVSISSSVYLDIVTSDAHGISDPGNYGVVTVFVSGMTPADYNGWHFVYSIPNSTTIRILLTENFGAPSVSSGTVKASPSAVSAIYCDAWDNSYGALLEVDGCSFGPGITFPVNLNQGGLVVFSGNTIHSLAMFRLASSSSLRTIAHVRKNFCMPTIGFFGFFISEALTTSQVDVYFDAQVVPGRAAYYRTSAGATGGLVIHGRRVVDKANPDVAGEQTLPNDWVQRLGDPMDYKGSGSPEGVVVAAIGSRYSRSDGGSATSLYVKESGTGNTGWVAK